MIWPLEKICQQPDDPKPKSSPRMMALEQEAFQAFSLYDKDGDGNENAG